MKKSVLFFVLFSIVVLMSGCRPEAKLGFMVGVASSQCPMEVDDGLECTDITIEGNSVVFVCEMDEDDVLVSELNNPFVKESMRSVWLEEYSSGDDEDLQELIALCREAKYDLVYRFQGKSSGSVVDITISWAEL